jgi:hypothetical protein
MGIQDSTNKKASLGTIVHKVMEMLAEQKVAQDNKQMSFKDDHFGEIVYGSNTLSNIDRYVDLAFKFYSEGDTDNQYDNKDKITCINWCNDAITNHNGLYNPLNRDIVDIEKQFDLELPYEWAYYLYNLNNNVHHGQFSLKGTIDLITKIDDDTLEVIDYKTGKRLNWATGKQKDLESLRNDHQLRMYHYAIYRMYNIKNLMFTIYYINDGGPYTVPFYESDIPTTIQMIKSKFMDIYTDKDPKRIINDRNLNWKCKRLCRFHKDKMNVKENVDDLSICDFVHESVQLIGIDETVCKFGDLNKINIYGDAAGRKV